MERRSLYWNGAQEVSKFCILMLILNLESVIYASLYAAKTCLLSYLFMHNTKSNAANRTEYQLPRM